MGKQTGLGDNAYLHGVDLSGDVTSLGTIRGGPAAIEMTGIDKSAREHIGGQRDGEISFVSMFNDGAGTDRAGAAGSSFYQLSSLPTTDVHVMYCRGTTLGNRAASMVAKQINHDGSRGADGSFTLPVQCLGNGYGLEWGRLLTAGKRTDTEATNGSSIDDGAASSNGLQIYLQQFAGFTGTDATVKVQESSDDGGGDAYADVVGGGFTQITTDTPGGERIATATDLAVERHLRAVTVTTGGFTSLTFAVNVVRNSAVPAF